MIKHLSIRNYAIIEALDLDFSNGLTIITGETGAGKSILMGALGLIMGKRADTKSLYEKDKKCIVEGTFSIEKYHLKTFFDAFDLDYESEMVIRRELTPAGKSRAFINDTPVNLKVLKQLTDSLIDLHQQFDTLDIHEVSFQLRMIDALAGNQKKLEDYQKKFILYRATQKELDTLKNKTAEAKREKEFIQFQLEEFEKANIVAGEQLKMEDELKQMNNAELIKRTLNDAFNTIVDDEPSMVGKMNEIYNSIQQIVAFVPALESQAERFNGIILEMEDIANEFLHIADKTEYSGNQIEIYNEKLDLIYKLLNKHNVREDNELVQIQEKLSSQLQGYEDLGSQIEALETALMQQKSKLSSIAESLSKSRKKVIPKFEKDVHQLLSSLSMENAKLVIDISSSDDLTKTGQDAIEYLFCANKGGVPLPIKDVASGGELSRLTLCTKSLVASAIPLPTLIFDEIDAGVSGEVALKMGKILRNLSNQHQIVCITHSPQIAAKADTHYYAYKKDISGRTITKVKALDKTERIRAIATMLSTNPPSDSAIENAKELLTL